MKLNSFMNAGWSLGKVRLFGARVPLFISWAATYRCNRRCSYCRYWENTAEDMPSAEALALVDEFAALGTRRLTFTGGEPLLREDIDKLAARCQKKHIDVNLNTNGFLLPDREDILEHVRSVTLSLDGPKEVNDATRGEGAFDSFHMAAALVKKHGRKLNITTVLSKVNLPHIDFLLDVCREYSCNVSFHPVFTQDPLWPGDYSPLRPDSEELAAASRRLMEIKKTRGAPLADSIYTLGSIPNPPDSSAIPCYSGRIFFRLTPDGKLKACEWRRFSMRDQEADALVLGVKEAMRRLQPPECDGCRCPQVADFNMALHGNLKVLFHTIRNS